MIKTFEAKQIKLNQSQMQGEILVLFSSKTAAFCCVQQVSPDLAGSTQVVAEKVDADFESQA